MFVRREAKDRRRNSCDTAINSLIGPTQKESDIIDKVTYID